MNSTSLNPQILQKPKTLSDNTPAKPRTHLKRRSLPRHEPPRCLMFSPLAWLKLMFFLHAGDTEIGGFAISSADDPLYIERFVTVRQTNSCVTVEFADVAVADFFDDCVDQNLKPERFARIWLHTHPGDSPEPSGTDEDTFERVFGACDWSVMFIIGRTGQTYARLAFQAGPGGALLLPVAVDWPEWPKQMLATDLKQQMDQWQQEYDQHIHPTRTLSFKDLGDLDSAAPYGADPVDSLIRWWDYEEYEPQHVGFDHGIIASEWEVDS